jgi:thiol-disulfide isomerase/thioredoxin
MAQTTEILKDSAWRSSPPHLLTRKNVEIQVTSKYYSVTDMSATENFHRRDRRATQRGQAYCARSATASVSEMKHLFSRRTRIIRTISIVILLIALPAAALGQNRQATDLGLKDLRGRTLKISNFKGKVVLLNFWATWCPPCRAEMPDLVKWQREYRTHGLRVVGITYPPQELNEVLQFTRKLKVNYPIALGTEETKKLFFQGDTLPLTVVIDREGNIREVIEGILLPEEFEQKIKPLLSE